MANTILAHGITPIHVSAIDGTTGLPQVNNAAAPFAVSPHMQEIVAVEENSEPYVSVEELYLGAMFAVQSVSTPPPKSLQVPYQAVSVYTRTLHHTRWLGLLMSPID